MGTAAYMEFNGYPCVSPSALASEIQRLSSSGVCIDTNDWYGLANSFHDQRGSDPSFGYLLVPSEAVTNANPPRTGLRIQMRDGTMRHWNTLKIEWAKKISPAPKIETGYYLIYVVDRRYRLAREFVGRRCNRVIGYTAPEPDALPNVKGTFDYDNDTIKTVAGQAGTSSPNLGPWNWKQLYEMTFGQAVGFFSSINADDYPKYNPQDLDWRYVTKKCALDQLLYLHNFTIQPFPNGTYRLVKVGGDANDFLTIIDQFKQYIAKDNWRRFKAPGEPAANLNLHIQLFQPNNPLADQYYEVTRTPDTSNISSDYHLDVRLPSYAFILTPGIDTAKFPPEQLEDAVADDFKERSDVYFQQFPPIERTFSGFCFGPGFFPNNLIESITYYDLGSGPFTHIVSAKKRDWSCLLPYQIDAEPPIVTMYEGKTTGPVTGGNWDMNALIRLSGALLPSGTTTIEGVVNPDNWFGNGRAVAVKLPNGTWRGIDLRCDPNNPDS